MSDEPSDKRDPDSVKPDGREDASAEERAERAKPVEDAAETKETVRAEPVEGAVDPEPPGAERGDLETESAQELAVPSVGDVRAPHVRRGLFGATGSGDTSGYGGLVRTIEYPAPSHRPYGEGDTAWFDDVIDRLVNVAPELGEPIVVVHRGELTLHVPREHLQPVVKQLRDDPHLRFEFCSSVSGVHYPTDTGHELHAVYQLQSMTHNRRIRVEVSCPDSDPHIPSVVATYPAADWHERETWDMFGIIFDDHPGLTRILMPDDWPGHPQRKDYPLGGIDVEYKGATIPPPDQRRSYH